MMLPRPTDQLAGCVWLPRILAKARLLQKALLPPDYAARFCHPSGVDGHFLAHFGLNRDEIVAAAAKPDDAAAAWFRSRASDDAIRRWNETSVNFGRPGYPLADRFPVALATIYKNYASRGFTTVFEVLEADDKEA